MLAEMTNQSSPVRIAFQMPRCNMMKFYYPLFELVNVGDDVLNAIDDA